MTDDFLLLFGPHARDFIVGAMGGVSISFADKKLSAGSLIGNVVAGAFTATCCNPALSGFGVVYPLFTAYFFGVGGKMICRKGAKRAASFLDRINQ